MSDLEVLWVVLVSLYTWECLCWIPRSSTAFLTRTGRHWRISHPPSALANQRGGFILANPFPPLGTILIANHLPFSLAPEGILPHDIDSTQPFQHKVANCSVVSFDEVRSARSAGRKIHVGKRILMITASSTLARQLVQSLRSLARLPPQERHAGIQELLRASLDADAIQRRWGEFTQSSQALRWLCNGLFVYIFVLAPVVIQMVGLKRCWLALLMALFATTTAIAWRFRHAHKALYPNADEERFTQFLTILLAPTTAIRAVDVLSRPLVEAFHPLAVARLFSPKESFATVARRVWAELQYPASPPDSCPNGVVDEIELRSREDWRRPMEHFLRDSGIDLGDLARPPMPMDASCRSYCPRCLAQFVLSSGECGDCGGVVLREIGHSK